jgi:hypothetical protein
VLPPFELERPWWQEAWDVVAGARAAQGIDVVVLRLLGADRPEPPGGAVTYLAQYDGPPLNIPVDTTDWTTPHPLRMPWANPGGPAASLAWARQMLGDLGTPAQHRTWNLSSLWRLDGAWLKEVPPFFAHEPAVLGWLGRELPGLAPRLLGADGTRMVLEHVPGTDRYDAELDETIAVLDDLLPLQLLAAGRIDELLELGVPDRRAEPFLHEVHAVVDEWADRLDRSERSRLDQLVAGLPRRFADIAECGVPDTLMHGDFHAGNTRSDGVTRAILDWGDCTIGHPAADPLTLIHRSPPEFGRVLRRHWCAQWRSAVPGSEPERALALMEPVESLRGAVIYSAFLAGIEPSERPYHAGDPLRCLRSAANPVTVDAPLE